MLPFDYKSVLKYKKWLKFEKLKMNKNDVSQIASKHTTVKENPFAEFCHQSQMQRSVKILYVILVLVDITKQ